MDIVGTDAVDLYLDENFQPAAETDGSEKLVSGDDCWMQDIRAEAACEENELFYEEESEADNYGFGMMDFKDCEDDGDGNLALEVETRIKDKLAKRDYIDPMSIQIGVEASDILNVSVAFRKKDDTDEYNIDLTVDEAEVIVE